eukprot:scaffold578404_cov51-Prasinocladus_malaysianus.AAC.1
MLSQQHADRDACKRMVHRLCTSSGSSGRELLGGLLLACGTSLHSSKDQLSQCPHHTSTVFV